MARVSRSVCLVGCSLLLASLFLIVPPAMGNDMVVSQCSVQDEAALLQKETQVTVRASENAEPETDANGVMAMPEFARAPKVTHLKPISPDDLKPGEKLPSGQSFEGNMKENDERRYMAEISRTPEQQKAYQEFIDSPNKPGHVHYRPGTLFIPEKDSAKMQQAFVKANELVKKAKQTRKGVIAGVEKAEEMVMVSMPSLDEVSEEIVEEDKEGKYHEMGGSTRRRRVSLQEALPEGLKRRLAEAPERVIELREKREEQRVNARKVWDINTQTGTQAAAQEVQSQAKDAVSKRVRSIGETISKWTTTTEAPEAAASVDDSDDSASTMTSVAMWLNLLLLLSVIYSSS